jgi:hypothetical protein
VQVKKILVQSSSRHVTNLLVNLWHAFMFENSFEDRTILYDFEQNTSKYVTRIKESINKGLDVSGIVLDFISVFEKDIPEVFVYEVDHPVSEGVLFLTELKGIADPLCSELIDLVLYCEGVEAEPGHLLEREALLVRIKELCVK